MNFFVTSIISEKVKYISSIDVELSDEILRKIDEIQELQPNPAP